MTAVDAFTIGRLYVRAIMEGELIHDEDHEAAKAVVSIIQLITGVSSEVIIEEFFSGIQYALNELPTPPGDKPNDLNGMLSLLQTMQPEHTSIGPGLCNPQQWVLLCVLDPEHRRTVPGCFHA